MPKVIFTSHLQRHVSCAESTVAGATLSEALQAVFESQPQVRGYVLDEQGRLRRHVVVFIDGVRCRHSDVMTQPVGEASEIYVMQALSGG